MKVMNPKCGPDFLGPNILKNGWDPTPKLYILLTFVSRSKKHKKYVDHKPRG